MKRYKTTTLIVGTANVRTLQEILKGAEGTPRHVEAIAFVEMTGTLQNDAILEAWVEQEQILEVPQIALLNGATTPLRLTEGWIELDLDLPVGKGLEVGFMSGSTKSDYYVTARYTQPD